MGIFTNLGMGPEQIDDDYRNAINFMKRHYGLDDAVSRRDNLDIVLDFSRCGFDFQSIIPRNFINKERHYVLVDPYKILLTNTDCIGCFDIERTESNVKGPYLEITNFDCDELSGLPKVHYTSITISANNTLRDFTTVPKATNVKIQHSGIHSLKGIGKNTSKLAIEFCPELDSLKDIPNGMNSVEIKMNHPELINQLLLTTNSLPRCLFIEPFPNSGSDNQWPNISQEAIEHLKSINNDYDVEVYIGGIYRGKREYIKNDGHKLTLYNY